MLCMDERSHCLLEDKKQKTHLSRGRKSSSKKFDPTETRTQGGRFRVSSVTDYTIGSYRCESQQKSSSYKRRQPPIFFPQCCLTHRRYSAEMRARHVLAVGTHTMSPKKQTPADSRCCGPEKGDLPHPRYARPLTEFAAVFTRLALYLRWRLVRCSAIGRSRGRAVLVNRRGLSSFVNDT